jgi:DNA-binding MarR family transcriptional regulator
MTAGLDEVLVPRQRLQICSMLSRVSALSCETLRDSLRLSNSAVNMQLRILHAAGYVRLRKEPFNSRIHAWAELTPLGRTVLIAHLARLRALAGA